MPVPGLEPSFFDTMNEDDQSKTLYTLTKAVQIVASARYNNTSEDKITGPWDDKQLLKCSVVTNQYGWKYHALNGAAAYCTRYTSRVVLPLFLSQWIKQNSTISNLFAQILRLHGHSVVLHIYSGRLCYRALLCTFRAACCHRNLLLFFRKA